MPRSGWLTVLRVAIAIKFAVAQAQDCSDSPDVAQYCSHWAQAGECEKNRAYMAAHCGASCGCPPSVTVPAPDPACQDKDTTGACSHWAANGECEKNPSYMKLKCAATCGTCDMLDFKKRCPIDPEATPAVPPGAMRETFQRAMSNYPQYSPQMLSEDPPVISFEDFISDDEIAALLRHAEGRFVRSTASGGRSDDDEFIPLTSEIRTSDTTWCDTKECLADEHVQALSRRMAELTRVPSTNHSEFIQLLRYLPCKAPTDTDCQFYRRHHDTIPELEAMPCGPRVYTFFLYLSDVEEGGGTKFDGGFTVQPKRGRAVLWPATFNDRPFIKDDRTHHEALPVLRGTKFAANFWIHQFDYVTAHHRGCTA